jgi:hypothetical protein
MTLDEADWEYEKWHFRYYCLMYAESLLPRYLLLWW